MNLDICHKVSCLIYGVGRTFLIIHLSLEIHRGTLPGLVSSWTPVNLHLLPAHRGSGMLTDRVFNICSSMQGCVCLCVQPVVRPCPDEQTMHSVFMRIMCVLSLSDSSV